MIAVVQLHDAILPSWKDQTYQGVEHVGRCKPQFTREESCSDSAISYSILPSRSVENPLKTSTAEKLLTVYVDSYPWGSNHLRMVMEPKYYAEEVIVHPNHHLTR